LGSGITAAQQMLLTDPQTSGGLLVSCAAEAVDSVLAVFREGGFEQAAVIGTMQAGPARVAVA
ncbi:MAG: AIR synthase-related protein, partial [Lacisediminimonas sp.]|nr:AIR synthase-related protein [Lacisediminimonas sp.]